ncbi:MAG: sugar transferase [Candidatus Acidiferrales bacterium]
MATLTLTGARVGARLPQGGRWFQAAYLVSDVFLINVNALLVYYLRFGSDWLMGRIPGHFLHNVEFPLRQSYLGFLLIYTFLVVLFCRSRDLYRTPRARSTFDESFALLQAVTLSSGLLIAFIYLSKQDISRMVLGLNAVLDVFALAGWRLWKRRVIERRVTRGVTARNVLIVGANEVGKHLAQYFEIHKHLGYVVRGFVDSNCNDDCRVLGRIENLRQLMVGHFIEEIFIAKPLDRELVKTVFVEARTNRVDVKLVPELYDGLAWKAPIEYLGDFPIMALHERPVHVFGQVIKRLMDILVSLTGLIVLSPVLFAVAIAILLDSSGPILYRSRRVGKKATSFVCYKFRTMVPNADSLKDGLRHLNEREGPCFKISDDPRLTRLGRFLRKYSLDELPQLWNVLRGDMSLVGPRPHPTDDFKRYTLEDLRRLGVTPGITGLWQICSRRDRSFERNRTFDTDYIEKWNLWLDIKILLRTIPAIFSGSGE